MIGSCPDPHHLSQCPYSDGILVRPLLRLQYRTAKYPHCNPRAIDGRLMMDGDRSGRRADSLRRADHSESARKADASTERPHRSASVCIGLHSSASCSGRRDYSHLIILRQKRGCKINARHLPASPQHLTPKLELVDGWK